MEHLHPARSLFLFLIEAKLSRAQARRGAALSCFFLPGVQKRGIMKKNSDAAQCGTALGGDRI